MLKNSDATFEDIKAAIMGIDTMTFTSAAEALFNPFKGGERPNPRQLSERIKGWRRK